MVSDASIPVCIGLESRKVGVFRAHLPIWLESFICPERAGGREQVHQSLGRYLRPIWGKTAFPSAAQSKRDCAARRKEKLMTSPQLGPTSATELCDGDRNADHPCPHPPSFPCGVFQKRTHCLPTHVLFPLTASDVEKM